MPNSFRTRIRKVRLKRNGAEIHVIESHRAKESRRVHKQLRDITGWVGRNHGDDIGGYALVVWDHEGAGLAHWAFNDACHAVRINNMAEFAKGAIQREIADLDVRDILKG